MNKEKLHISIGAAFILTLVSCADQPLKPIAPEIARVYETKAQIKNSTQSHTISIQLAVWPQKAVRMEVTATLGISVASILLTPQKIQILIPNDKTFIVGPFDEKTLYPVFKENINPRLIWKIIHEQNPADQNLKCQFNADLKPIACQGSDGLEVSWVYEDKPRKRISIKRRDFQMDWLFKTESPLLKYQNETFVLKKPETYKEIVIK